MRLYRSKNIRWSSRTNKKFERKDKFASPVCFVVSLSFSNPSLFDVAVYSRNKEGVSFASRKQASAISKCPIDRAKSPTCFQPVIFLVVFAISRASGNF